MCQNESLAIVSREFRLTLIVLCAAFAPILARLLLLHWRPIPEPTIHDEFCYLLAADTFASGRLANPTPPAWRHFETIYVLLQPAYIPKYPPGQGLALAAGQALFGHPWFGVLLSAALMTGAFAWMMTVWMPPRWSAAGILLMLAACYPLHYWLDSYWGGAVAAAGGAIALAAVRRNHAVALGLGAGLLALSRPLEGFLYCLPLFAVFFWRNRRRATAWLLFAAAVLPSFAFLALYNRANTGSAWKLPYFEYEEQYSLAPVWLFLPERPRPIYRHAELARFHEIISVTQQANSSPGQLAKRVLDILDLPPMAGAPWAPRAFFGMWLAVSLGLVLPERRIRLPLVCLALTLFAAFFGTYFFEHYAAPAAGAKLLIMTQGLRRAVARLGWLRRFRPAFAALLLPLTWILHPAVSAPRYYDIAVSKPRIARQLEQAPGKHLVLVRYAPDHDLHNEWIYNRADLDKARILWAREMENNWDVLGAFPDRRVWFLDPDRSPPLLVACSPLGRNVCPEAPPPSGSPARPLY